MLLPADNLPALLGYAVRDGRRFHVWSDGTVLPVISGGDGEGGEGAGGEGAGSGSGAGGQGAGGAAGGFTQEDLNRVAAKEKEEGKRAAAKEIADLLGVDPAEAKKLIEAHREAEKGRMTEAERLATEAAEKGKAADKAKADADARDAAAKKAERRLAVKEALIDAEVRKDRRDQALKLVDLPDDADDKAITEAIDKLKADLPEFFDAAAGKPAGGDPKGKPPRNQGGDEGAAGAEDRYRKAREQNGKPSDPFAGMTRIGA